MNKTFDKKTWLWLGVSSMVLASGLVLLNVGREKSEMMAQQSTMLENKQREIRRVSNDLNKLEDFMRRFKEDGGLAKESQVVEVSAKFTEKKLRQLEQLVKENYRNSTLFELHEFSLEHKEDGKKRDSIEVKLRGEKSVPIGMVSEN